MIFLYWVYISHLEKKVTCCLDYCLVTFCCLAANLFFTLFSNPVFLLTLLLHSYSLPSPISCTSCNAQVAFRFAWTCGQFVYFSSLVLGIIYCSITTPVNTILISFLDHCNDFEKSSTLAVLLHRQGDSLQQIKCFGNCLTGVRLCQRAQERKKREACAWWEGSCKPQLFGHHLHSVALKEALCKQKSIGPSFWQTCSWEDDVSHEIFTAFAFTVCLTRCVGPHF